MSRDRGFLLLDVVIAGLILSIGLTCLLEVTLTARHTANVSRMRAKAANLAQSELEKIKTLGVDQAVASGMILPGESVESVQDNGLLQVSSDWVPGNPDLLEIKAVVLWSFGPDSGSITLVTLLSRW